MGQAQCDNQKEIQRLATYLSNSDKNDTSHGPISDMVGAYKTQGEEQNKMVRLHDKIMAMYDEERKEYEAEFARLGKELDDYQQKRKQEVVNLYKQDVPIEVISTAMNIPEDEIVKLIKEDESTNCECK